MHDSNIHDLYCEIIVHYVSVLALGWGYYVDNMKMYLPLDILCELCGYDFQE